jgi:hypothetical protein
VDKTFKYKKQPLTRTARALTSFVSPALQSILSSWTAQLSSSITKKRDRLRSGRYNLQDFAAEELAVLDTTERMFRNLYAVAIYHILEQHLISFFYRQAGTKLGKTPTAMKKKKPQLYDVIQEIKNAWGINLKNASSWDAIDEIRRVANCVKHGDGPDCQKLKKSHADWFDGEFIAPLSGDGLKLPTDYLEKAVVFIEKFLSEFTDEIKKVER